jgi:hypothetical protein
MQLRDKRRELVQGRTFLECEQHVEDEEKARCEEEKLLERGELEAIERYYDYNIWCMSGMNQCLVDLVEQAAADAHAQLVAERRAEFFASDLATRLERDVVVAEAQLQYLRTTLPPVADNVCKDLDSVTECREGAVEQMVAVEEYLTIPQEDYDEERAKELLTEAKRAEIGCIEIERSCIMGKLDQYGATQRTRGLLEKNYELLERRQELLDQVAPAAGEQCLRSGQADEEAYIIANYRQYARRQIEYFRLQVHRAFIRVHRGQIRCLERL